MPEGTFMKLNLAWQVDFAGNGRPNDLAIWSDLARMPHSCLAFKKSAFSHFWGRKFDFLCLFKMTEIWDLEKLPFRVNALVFISFLIFWALFDSALGRSLMLLNFFLTIANFFFRIDFWASALDQYFSCFLWRARNLPLQCLTSDSKCTQSLQLSDELAYECSDCAEVNTKGILASIWRSVVSSVSPTSSS